MTIPLEDLRTDFAGEEGALVTAHIRMLIVGQALSKRGFSAKLTPSPKLLIEFNVPAENEIKPFPLDQFLGSPRIGISIVSPSSVVSI